MRLQFIPNLARNGQTSVMSSARFCKIEQLTVKRVQKCGPWHLERWYTHHLLPTKILTVLSQSYALPCNLVTEKTLVAGILAESSGMGDKAIISE